MRTKDYEAEYSRTVRIFLASVFLLHILWSRARKGIGSSLSRLVRTTASSPLRLTCEPSSPMTAFSRILFLVELEIAEMACVSRNIRRTLFVIVIFSYLYAFTYTQWFIDFLLITRDSRKSNKLCGRKTTKQKELTL